MSLQPMPVRSALRQLDDFVRLEYLDQLIPELRDRAIRSARRLKAAPGRCYRLGAFHPQQEEGNPS